MMRVLKAILKFIKSVLEETIMQLFTIVGLFIAWICLTDMAKVVSGWAILFTTVIYLIYIGIKGTKGDE